MSYLLQLFFMFCNHCTRVLANEINFNHHLLFMIGMYGIAHIQTFTLHSQYNTIIAGKGILKDEIASQRRGKKTSVYLFNERER